MSELTDYIAELRARHEGYTGEAVERLREEFYRRERRPPNRFHESSFLYLRSYQGDTGSRPFAGPVFWDSPDIQVSPSNNVATYTTTLQAGDTYRIRVSLRNRGDLAVPSAKVELFLTDPTIGFDTRFATRLTGIGTVPAVWVGALSSASVDFSYTVPATEVGHKCLFARAFSFSPLEMPLDDHALDPRLDRHVAQKNLHIVGQSQPYQFTLVHHLQAQVLLKWRPLAVDEVRRLDHPLVATADVAREFPRRGWAEMTGAALIEPGRADVTVGFEGPDALLVQSSGDGVDPDTQRQIDREVREVIAQVEAGKARWSEHRDLAAKARAVNAERTRSRFEMRMPDLGLADGEIVAIEVAGVALGVGREDPLGGVVIIIQGG